MSHDKRRTRRWLGRGGGWAALVGIVLIAGCSVPLLHHGSLTYRVEPGPGHIKLALTDDRSGRNTSWITLRDSNGKIVSGGWVTFHDGSDNTSQTASTTVALAAGTYRYHVYDISGIHYSQGGTDGPAKDRVASGTVTVP